MTRAPCARWSRWGDLNPRPTDYKSVALPLQLQRHILLFLMVEQAGIEPAQMSRYQLLYLLSYCSVYKSPEPGGGPGLIAHK